MKVSVGVRILLWLLSLGIVGTFLGRGWCFMSAILLACLCRIGLKSASSTRFAFAVGWILWGTIVGSFVFQIRRDAVRPSTNPLDARLLDAAEQGNCAVAVSLLDQGANVDARRFSEPRTRWEPLLNFNTRMEYPDYPFQQGYTPLMLASIGGHRDMAELLLIRGADTEATESKRSHETPLYFAVSYNHPDLVSLLLAHGAHVQDKSEDGGLLMLAATEPKDLAIMEILVRAGAPIDGSDSDGKTALIVAIKRDNALAVAFLLAHGADKQRKDGQGRTALELALQHLIQLQEPSSWPLSPETEKIVNDSIQRSQHIIQLLLQARVH